MDFNPTPLSVLATSALAGLARESDEAGTLVAMAKTWTVRLNEQMAARVDEVAPAQGLDPEQWVNDRFARDLFLAKLDEVQAGNPDPRSEEEAAKVVYGR